MGARGKRRQLQVPSRLSLPKRRRQRADRVRRQDPVRVPPPVAEPPKQLRPLLGLYAVQPTPCPEGSIQHCFGEPAVRSQELELARRRRASQGIAGPLQQGDQPAGVQPVCPGGE